MPRFITLRDSPTNHRFSSSFSCRPVSGIRAALSIERCIALVASADFPSAVSPVPAVISLRICGARSCLFETSADTHTACVVARIDSALASGDYHSSC